MYFQTNGLGARIERLIPKVAKMWGNLIFGENIFACTEKIKPKLKKKKEKLLR